MNSQWELLFPRSHNEILSSDDSSISGIQFYAPCVNDVVCVWSGDDNKFHNHLSIFNQFHSTMEFTIEVGGATLNFFDLTLTVTPYVRGSKVEINIYCKQTFTGVSMHHDSCHPQSHRFTTINQAIHRLILIPSLFTKAENMEIQTIQ